MKTLTMVVAVALATVSVPSMGVAAGLVPVEIITPSGAPLVITEATAWLRPYPHPLLQDGKRADHVPSLALRVAQVRNVADRGITAFELHAQAFNPFGEEVRLRNINVVSAWNTSWTGEISTVSDANVYIHVPSKPVLKGTKAGVGLTYWAYQGTIGRVVVTVSRVKFEDSSVWKTSEPAVVRGAQDDAETMIAKAAIVAALHRQLLDVYQGQGLQAMLAQLRIKPSGTDLTAVTIADERQRLLAIYEDHGEQALLAELQRVPSPSP
ncbi:MAG TPA: hypothetical protein VGZ23_14485 [bacterium]|nr:hypothetical protein [bacterium]